MSAARVRSESFGSNSREDAELGVLRVGDVEVELVAAAPEEGLATGHPLDVVGDDAAALEHGELLGAEVIADRADRVDLGEEAGGEGEMDGGAAEHALALPERGLDGIKGD